MFLKYIIYIAAFTMATYSFAVEIVVDSRPVANIIVPEKSNPLIDYAATELQKHIEKASGARLKIIHESSETISDGKAAIFLGNTKAAQNAGLEVESLPPNTFYIKAEKDTLFLIGKDDIGDPLKDSTLSMGSLFAVYRWLDEQLGIRWLWPGKNGTVVPEKLTITASPEEKIVKPWSKHSRIRAWGFTDKMLPKERKTYLREVNTWLLRQMINQPINFSYGHAYTEYWEKFGKEHPEYFALRPDGIREPIDERVNLVQMCVSNTGLQKQIIKDWLVQKKNKPSYPWVNGIENDRRPIDPFCQCAACLAWDAPESENEIKSYSDRYARYWLSLQKAAKEYISDPKVIGYAYSDYREPPVQTKLNSDIIIGIVPELGKHFRKQWKGWYETGAALYLRPNYFLIGYAMPYIYARQFGEDFKFAKKHGMVATDFDSLTGMWGAQGPNLYMLGRLHANPDLEVDEVLEEYYSAFGPARDSIREYFEYWEEVTKKFDDGFESRNGGGWGFVSKAGDIVYTPEVFEKGRVLLTKAIKETANTPQAAKRVRFLDIWLKHAELCMDTLRAFRAKGNGKADRDLTQKFLTAKETLDKFRKEHPEEFSAANMGVTKQLEIWSGWRSSK